MQEEGRGHPHARAEVKLPEPSRPSHVKAPTLLKMTNPSWDPTSFYLGLIPYRIGTQHPNSRRDFSFLCKRCREQKYFVRTKMKIRKNCIVGIFLKSFLELGQIPI